LQNKSRKHSLGLPIAPKSKAHRDLQTAKNLTYRPVADLAKNSLLTFGNASGDFSPQRSRFAAAILPQQYSGAEACRFLFAFLML
jgi:hypothetical protein